MSQTNQTSFSLDELSHESGFETRVIRSFIEQGLMRGPTSLGRYARYSRHHLERLQAIKILKEKQGLRLSEVRQQLLLMSDAEIEALAETGSYVAKAGDTTALDYILSQSAQFDTGQVQALSSSSAADDVIRKVSDDSISSQADAGRIHSDKSEGNPRSLTDAIKKKLGLKPKSERSMGLRLHGGDATPEGLAEHVRLTAARAQQENFSKEDVLGESAFDANHVLQNCSSEGSNIDSSLEMLPSQNDENKYTASTSEPDREDKPPHLVAAENDVWEAFDDQRITQNRLATPVDRLVFGLQQQVGSKTVRKQAKKEVWHRIQVTPDIELSVRGIQNEQHLARLERVADYLRELLTGGGYD